MDVQGSTATAKGPMLDSYGHERIQAFPAQGLSRLQPMTPALWESYASASWTSHDFGDKEVNEAEPRVREVSKLNLKIANGEGPKRGANGPMGEVRFGEDGSMEFRDVDNPAWIKCIHASI